MINFLKKNWRVIVYVIVFSMLLLYIIPNQEEQYIETDINIIKKKTQIAAVWIDGALFIILFIFGVKQVKKFTEFVNLFFGLAALSLALYFILKPLCLSGAYFLNQLKTTTISDKKYRVVYADKDGHFLLLFDDLLQKGIRADQLFLTNSSQFVEGHTITITFKKGLLGYNFDPVIKAN